jgi:hypothetical protein
VTQVELDYGISAGIQLCMIGIDMVPVQEEHEARLERGIGLDAWSRMPMMEKALIVAVRRIRNAMSNIRTEAEIRQAERNMKKKS